MDRTRGGDPADHPPRQGTSGSTARARRGEEAGGGIGLGLVPGIARLGIGAGLRTAEWTLVSSVRAGRAVARMAVTGQPLTELAREARDALLENARRVLGVTEIEARLGVGEAEPGTRTGRNGGGDELLRRQGEALLERAAEVATDPDPHPAYERILGQLAPDEARVLRLLASDGPRASVDVRTWRPLDVGSRIVAPGLSMIAEYAGVRHSDRVPAYLNNLFRLGLIWFSREPVDDRTAYQVLEAQPAVTEAIGEAGRARTVRRSIRLTPFGDDFCRTCLPLDETGATGGPAAGPGSAAAAAAPGSPREGGTDRG